MKMWLVSRTDRVGYDEHDSAVVRAEDENIARILASECCVPKEPFIDVTRSEVTGVSVEGAAEVVLSSFNAG